MAQTSPKTLEIILNSSKNPGKIITTLSNDNYHLIDFMRSIIAERQETKESFYILDLIAVVALIDRWSHALPMVKTFYAVKCNPDPALLGTLAAVGYNFDCASKVEIESVLSLGVSPDRIIYANPCKSESHIKYAATIGVNLTTFDSKGELEKIKKWHPKCDLLIRIKAPDETGASFPLSSKYGAFIEEVEPLLKAAQTMQLNVVGVCFHIGSGSTNVLAYEAAIAAVKNVFETASQLGMPKLNVLDIGGGFTASSYFDEAATMIKSAIQCYFADQPDLKIMAEPGRFFAETVFTLATNIIGKRVRGESREYWISEGIYGSFNFVLFDVTLTCIPFAYISNRANPTCKGSPMYSSTIFGPTLDAVDIVMKACKLPELEVDDWLIFPNMGAYTMCCGTNFNGFSRAPIFAYIT